MYLWRRKNNWGLPREKNFLPEKGKEAVIFQISPFFFFSVQNMSALISHFIHIFTVHIVLLYNELSSRCWKLHELCFNNKFWHSNDFWSIWIDNCWFYVFNTHCKSSKLSISWMKVLFACFLPFSDPSDSFCCRQDILGIIVVVVVSPTP